MSQLVIARLVGIASLIAAAVALYSGMYGLEVRELGLAVPVISEIVGLTCGLIAIVQWCDDEGRSDLPALVLGIIGCALAVLLGALTILVLGFAGLAYA